MSIEAATAFRAYVIEHPDLHESIATRSAHGGMDQIVLLASEHGFEFTAEEGRTVWAEAQTEELSEFELEMVAGGAPNAIC